MLHTAVTHPLQQLYENLIIGERPLISGAPSTRPGWCGPNDVSWRIFSDPSAVVAVILAMLQQATHPLIAHAFLAHDDAVRNPYRRIHLTSGFYFATTFGTYDDAVRWVKRARQGHKPVHGVTPDGTRYSAAQPALLSWAHLCVLDASLRAWDTFGPGPRLTTAEKDSFCQEQALAAALIGVPEPPMTYRSLQSALSVSAPSRESNAECRAAARTVMEPNIPLWSKPFYGLMAQGALSLLPTDRAAVLGLPRHSAGVAANLPVLFLRHALAPLSVVETARQREEHQLARVDVTPGEPLYLTGTAWREGRAWQAEHPSETRWVTAWFLGTPEERTLLMEAAPRPALSSTGDLSMAAAAAGAWEAAATRGWAAVWRRALRRQ